MLNIVRLWWERDYGFTDSRVVDSRSGVSMYVTKYVVKQSGVYWFGGPGWQ